MDTPLRLAELVATLALAQDNAFGQPPESQLRSCLLASWMCDDAGVDRDVSETVYWVALLRCIGCTGHAHDVVAFATAGRSPEERDEIVRMIQETAHEWAVPDFASGCEVADMILARLDFGPAVRDALAFTFERWNGNGFPMHASGEAIPLAMRVVHLSHDMAAIGRLFSPERAVVAARERRGRTYDPALADMFVEHGPAWFDRLGETEPWDAVLALEPEPHRVLAGEDLDDALTVAADFIDLKSAYSGGHGRRCGQLAADAARVLGFTEDAVTALRRAALVHDFRHHRRLQRDDGSGHHERLRADSGDPGASVLAAAEVYVGLTSERADRPASSAEDAAAELRRLEAEGLLESRGTRAVLVAAGHGEPGDHARRRRQTPAGLSRREVDVLRLAARGLTTREIAERLVISPKTADHHIQHIYTKIGVSTRAAAAVWAIQNELVR